MSLFAAAGPDEKVLPQATVTEERKLKTEDLAPRGPGTNKGHS